MQSNYFAKLVFTCVSLAAVVSCGSDPALSGRVIFDDNADGVRTGDERGLEGFVVFIDVNRDSLRQPDEPFAITNSSGNWSIDEVPEGVEEPFLIMQELPFSWTNTLATGQVESFTTAIIGGESTTTSEYPFMTALWDDGQYCGGALIAGNYVITAAHCVAFGSPPGVMLGSEDLQRPGEIIAVERTIIHPEFRNVSSGYDVAILELRRTALHQRVDIISEALFASGFTAPGVLARTVGWGRTDNGSSPDILRDVEVPLVDQDACNSAYNGGVTDDMICAGRLGVGGVDSCQGDSGGPLVIYNDETERYVHVGVTSWGNGCGLADYPGVYARTSEVLSFIFDNVEPETSERILAMPGDSELIFGNFR